MGKTQPEPSAAGWRLVLGWVGWWGAASWVGRVKMLGHSKTPAGVNIPWRAHTKFRSCCYVPECSAYQLSAPHQSQAGMSGAPQGSRILALTSLSP